MVSFLQKEIGYNRVVGNIGGEVGMTFKLPLIEGYDAMYQGRYGEFINATSNGIVVPGDRSVVTFNKNGLYRDQALQLLGAALHSSSLPLPKQRDIGTEPSEFRACHRGHRYRIHVR